MSMTNYLEDKILQHALGILSYTPAAPVYLGLLSEVLDDGDSYTEINPLVAPSYARVAAAAAAWMSPTTGSTRNVGDIAWPTPTEDWGAVNYIGVFDAAASGQLLWVAQLSVSKLISQSSIFKILSGQSVFALSGAYGQYLRNGVLDFIFRNQSLASPGGIWVGLGTSVGSSLSSLSEPSGSYNYSRYALTPGSDFTQVSNATYRINTAITFAASGGNWGSITHVGFYDAATNGNLLFGLALPTARTIYDGDALQFDADTIIIRAS